MRRLKKDKPEPQNNECSVVIRTAGKKPVKVKAWKYFSIINEMAWLGAKRSTAEEAAQWARKAKPGEKYYPGDAFELEAVIDVQK